MTAAQALTPGLASSSSSSARSSVAGGGGERGGASFRDTLDRASRGPSESSAESRKRAETQPQSSARHPSGKRDADASAAGHETAEATGAAPSHASPDATQPPRNAPSSPAREGSEGASSLAQRLQAMLGGVDAPAHGVTAGEQGPWVPGAVDDGETFDATRLLAIMRSDGAQAANTTAGATVVTVLGQERHLALAGMPPELASVLQQEQDLAATLRSEAKAAANAAALSSQGDSAADGLERVRGKADGDEIGRLAPEIGPGRRGALFASEGRGQSGAGLGGDQGPGSQQQEGRSSGNGGQSQASPFASAMQGPGLPAANLVRGAGATITPHESASDQIAARIRTELTAGGLGEPSSEGVVKVLNLELKPANLGAVTLRMQLKDNVISLHVETQHAETRALIEREQARLTSALTAAGYSVETITAVQSDGVRSGGMVTPGDAASGGFHEAGNQNQGSQDFSGDGYSGRSSAGSGQQRFGAGDQDESSAPAQRGVDGVYV